MNTKIFLSALMFILCAFSFNANAQLEVETSGDVKTSKNLEVGNNSSIGKNLTVGDNLTVEDNMIVGKNLTIGNICEVADTLKTRTYLNVTKSATIGANLNVSGRTHISKYTAIGTNLDSTIALNVGKIVPVRQGNNNQKYFGIKSHVRTQISTPTLPAYAIYGVADSFSSNSSYPGDDMVGVCGYACKSYQACNSFAAGVVGLTYYYGGIGVYGAISSGSIPTSLANDEKYAGYFSGTVKVNGTLTATNVSVTSDARFKEDINDLSSKELNGLEKLRPVTYKLKQDSAWQYDKDAKELQDIHYGLIAQEVQKIYPHLVYQRGEQLSINYIELIPLLIMKIQELSIEVEKLKAQQTK